MSSDVITLSVDMGGEVHTFDVDAKLNSLVGAHLEGCVGAARQLEHVGPDETYSVWCSTVKGIENFIARLGDTKLSYFFASNRWLWLPNTRGKWATDPA